jgi:hypothetical protein
VDGTVTVVVQAPPGLEQSPLIEPLTLTAGGVPPSVVRFRETCARIVRVRLRDDPDTELAADVAFVRRDAVEAFRWEVGARSVPLAAVSNPSVALAASTIALPTSERFDVMVRPLSGAPASRFLDLFRPDCDDELTFAVGPGRVLRGRVFNALDAEESLAAVRVWATSDRTGLSTPSIVTTESGLYALRLPDEAIGGELRRSPESFVLNAQRLDELTSPADPEGTLLPSWRYRASVVFPEDEDSLVQDIPLEPTPDIRACTTLDVRGELPEDELGAVPNTEVVILHKEAPSDTTSYEVAGRTDERGRLRVFTADADLVRSVPGTPAEPTLTSTVPLLAWPADVLVRPPPGSPYRSQVFDHRELTGPDGGFRELARCNRTQPSERSVLLELQNVRPRITGTIEGEDVGPVLVEIIPIEPDADRRPVQVRTDGDGRFAAFVEPGRYLVVATPGEGPWAVWSRSVTVEDTIGIGSIRLPPSAPLELRVEDPVGTPVPDARVSVYQVVDGVAFRLDQTRTDAQGRFQARIPAASSRP